MHRAAISAQKKNRKTEERDMVTEQSSNGANSLQFWKESFKSSTTSARKKKKGGRERKMQRDLK